MNGDYKANAGAVVEINTQLVDDTSQHGTLVIGGQVTADSAVSGVRVIPLSGTGATTDIGIEIIRILGTADHTAEGQKFALISDFTAPDGRPAVVAGAYSYIMEDDFDYDYAAGSFNTGASGIFLRNAKKPDGSLVLNPSTPLYEVYSLMLGNLNRLPTLEQRVGHRNWLNSAGGEVVQGGGMWISLEGSHGEFKPKLGSGGHGKYDLNYGRINLGCDYPILKFNDDSRLIGGFNLNFGWGRSKVRSDNGNGKLNTNNRGVGATLTWYDVNGFYADAQARYNWYSTDIKSSTIHYAGHQVNSNDGDGYAFSLEAGYVVDLDESWSLTPQAQLVYSNTSFDYFTDPQYTTVVNEKDYQSLEGRLGLALNYENSYESDGEVSRNKFYGLANYYHEFDGEATVSISGMKYKSKVSKDWLGLAVGGSHNWADDRYSVYGEVGAKSSTDHFGREYELRGEVGFRLSF